jgi:hypothetical protein
VSSLKYPSAELRDEKNESPGVSGTERVSLSLLSVCVSLASLDSNAARSNAHQMQQSY